MATQAGFFEGKKGRNRLIAIGAGSALAAAGLAFAIAFPTSRPAPTAESVEEAPQEAVVDVPVTADPDSPEAQQAAERVERQEGLAWLNTAEGVENLDVFTDSELIDLGAAIKRHLQEVGASADSIVKIPRKAETGATGKTVWLHINDEYLTAQLAGAWTIRDLSIHMEGVNDELYEVDAEEVDPDSAQQASSAQSSPAQTVETHEGSDQSSSQTVWIAPDYGTEYHVKKNCTELNKANEIKAITRGKAIREGYTACDVCAGSSTSSTSSSSRTTSSTTSTTGTGTSSRTTSSATGSSSATKSASLVAVSDPSLSSILPQACAQAAPAAWGGWAAGRLPSDAGTAYVPSDSVATQGEWIGFSVLVQKGQSAEYYLYQAWFSSTDGSWSFFEVN